VRTNEEIYNSHPHGDLIKMFDLMAEAQREALEAYRHKLANSFKFDDYKRGFILSADYFKEISTDQFINGGKK